MAAMFSDNAGIRDRKYPFRMTTEENEFLKAKAEELGVRDVATLIRQCIREKLVPPTAPQERG